MAKFCFFTDPAKLAAQQPAQAFGAISADQFNVTDLHTAAGDAIAVAVCDGQLRVQEDGSGKLTLILKPDGQPPFDFPFVSYFLYKGVEPSSLLSGGKVPEEVDADGKELAKVVWKTWEANDNPGDPDETALGLQLRPPAADYAADQPIDRLFYDYPKEKPPVRVKAGDRLAKFSALFGFEIVVEQIGRLGLLKQARSFQAIVAARPAGGAASNDAHTFLRGHDKEAILGFVDPCAFWGSFFQSKLRASGLPGSQKVKGDDVYAEILVGAGGEGAAAFANRNRAYLDLRDEHGHSLDYYRAGGGTFRLTGENGTSLTQDYYDPQPPRYGWPCCWLPDGALPTAATERYARIEIALPATDYSRPLLYVAAGWRINRSRKTLRALTGQDRFVDRAAEPDGVFLLPAELGAPLGGGNVPAFAASYQRINHFKRPRRDASTHPPTRAADAANLAPVPLGLLDHILPVPTALGPPAPGAATKIRVQSELVFVPWPSATGSAFVARPGFAEDALNVYLFLFPVTRFLRRSTRKEQPGAAAPPTLQYVGDFFADFLSPGTGAEFSVVTLTPSAGTTIQVVRASPADSDAILVIFERAELEATLLAGNSTTRVLEGSGLLSLARSPRNLDINGVGYVDGVVGYSRLTAPAVPAAGDTVARQTQHPFSSLHAHADV